MKTIVFSSLAAVILLIPGMESTIRAQEVSFRIAGAGNTYCMGINDSLWVAGYYTNAQGTFGFIYKQTDTILVSYPGSVNTYLYDINNDGIAVGAYNSGSSANNVGFKYNLQTQEMTVITAWLSGYQQVIPYKINNNDDVAGSYHLGTNNWIFTIFGGVSNGSIHYNYNPTYGIGLNDQNKVAGFYISGGQNHGLIRSGTGVFTSFDYPGAFKTKAYGINDSDVIVGEFSSTRGFIYKASPPASFQELLISGITELHPYDINNYGSITGYFRDSTNAMAGFIIRDRFLTELHYTDTSDAGVPVGVTADGNAAIKLKIIRTFGNSQVDCIKIELKDKNNLADVPLGKIGPTIAGADSSQTIVPSPAGNGQWEFYYVAPDVFSRTTNNNFYREVKAKITVHNNASNTDNIFEQLIRIIRPPVLLIHGLWGNGGAFLDLSNDLIASGRYNSALVGRVDYKPTNDRSFKDNAYVLPSSIAKIKSTWKALGYEAGRVDIVGHSMGAVLSRLYLQGPDYKDDIHKLISVNSPHSGSQGSNILVSLPPVVKSKTGLGGAALDDLCVNSAATRVLLNGPSLNHGIVPSHAITSATASLAPLFSNNFVGAVLYMAFRYSYPGMAVNLIPPLIFNGANDLVVAQNSQAGGCSAYSQFAEEWHCGITKNAAVRLKIQLLLEDSATSPNFSTGGFHPPTLLWNGSKKQPDTDILNPDSISFLYPVAGTIKTPGDSLNIKITSAPDISDIILFVKLSDDSAFIVDTAAPGFELIYAIPGYACGKVELLAMGLDSSGNVSVDSTFIMVLPAALPDSLFISSPEDSLVLSQGLPGKVYVSCMFSDSVIRDVTSLQGVQYQLLTNNAQYISNGTFMGINQGGDQLTVTYSGLSAGLPVFVGRYYLKIDTIHVLQDICYGDTFNFNGQLLDSSGTYYASYANQYGCDSTIVLHLSVSSLPPGQAGPVTGPVSASYGQAGLVYSVPAVAHATAYEWTLPPATSGNSDSSSIKVDFGTFGDSCMICVRGTNGCGEGGQGCIVVYQGETYDLQGMLTYDNASATPMNGSLISLLRDGNTVRQALTGNSGAFEFQNLEAGDYMFHLAANKPWGGVNAVDALLIMKHFVALIQLTGLRLKAADLNDFSGINAIDALLAMNRFAGISGSFVMGDWLYDCDGDTITIDTTTTYHIKGLCYGDVNGSYSPPAKGGDFSFCMPDHVIGDTEFSIYAPLPGTLRIHLIDVSGKRTALLPETPILAGERKFILGAGHYPLGTYWIEAEYDTRAVHRSRTVRVVLSE